jgi:hypothetical protein
MKCGLPTRTIGLACERECHLVRIENGFEVWVCEKHNGIVWRVKVQ